MNTPWTWTWKHTHKSTSIAEKSSLSQSMAQCHTPSPKPLAGCTAVIPILSFSDSPLPFTVEEFLWSSCKFFFFSFLTDESEYHGLLNHALYLRTLVISKCCCHQHMMQWIPLRCMSVYIRVPQRWKWWHCWVTDMHWYWYQVLISTDVFLILIDAAKFLS